MLHSSVIIPIKGLAPDIPPLFTSRSGTLLDKQHRRHDPGGAGGHQQPGSMGVAGLYQRLSNDLSPPVHRLPFDQDIDHGSVSHLGDCDGKPLGVCVCVRDCVFYFYVCVCVCIQPSLGIPGLSCFCAGMNISL